MPLCVTARNKCCNSPHFQLRAFCGQYPHIPVGNVNPNEELPSCVGKVCRMWAHVFDYYCVAALLHY